jgi:hypothetical protein
MARTTKHDDGGCRVDQEGGDLLIRKIVGYRKQKMSGDDGIVGAARREGKLEYPSLADFCSEYLTRRHREKHGEGCVFAATGQEAVRQPIEIRHELTEGFKKRVEHLSRSAPGKTSKEKRSAAMTAYSTLVGALVLARMSDDPELSDELLSVNRDVLLPKLARASP